jgi:hypothetical protein
VNHGTKEGYPGRSGKGKPLSAWAKTDAGSLLAGSGRLREDTEQNTRLAKMLGKARRTIQRGAYLHKDSGWNEKERYSADLAQLKADEEQREHGPDLKIGSDHRLCRAIRDEVSREKHSRIRHCCQIYARRMANRDPDSR